jgi:FkbM family methyltransferase
MLDLEGSIDSVLGESCRFIQVGSNDGVTNDLIHEQIKQKRWTGILIEPIPFIFQRLVDNYAGCEGLIFENVAVHETLSQIQLFYPEGDTQLASFRRDHFDFWPWVAASNCPIHVLNVPACRLDSIIEKYDFAHFDLLVIDTEGYDFGVLRSISLKKYCPPYICFESFYLEARGELGSCLEYLGQYGYSTLAWSSTNMLMHNRRHCL